MRRAHEDGTRDACDDERRTLARDVTRRDESGTVDSFSLVHSRGYQEFAFHGMGARERSPTREISHRQSAIVLHSARVVIRSLHPLEEVTITVHSHPRPHCDGCTQDEDHGVIITTHPDDLPRVTTGALHCDGCTTGIVAGKIIARAGRFATARTLRLCLDCLNDLDDALRDILARRRQAKEAT